MFVEVYYFILFAIMIFLYLHIYLHFRINNDSELLILEDISRKELTNMIYTKQPILFDGETFIYKRKNSEKDPEKNSETNSEKDPEKNSETNSEKDPEKNSETNSEKDLEKNIEIYKCDKLNVIETDIKYESTKILEPYVRFFTKCKLYEFNKKDHYKPHKNLECRNFYILHQGKAKITCIHPKYSENISKHTNQLKDDFLKKNLQIEMNENQILFVPNYWYVYIEAENSTLIEKIQYKTILNNVNILFENLFEKY